MNPLDYFFYRVYKSKHRRNPDEMDCFVYSVLVMMAITFFNLLTLSIFLQRKAVIPDLINSKTTVVVINFLILIFYSWYFYSNRRYR
jgi:hypothetical protein